MQVPFRQGIVRSTPNFLQITGSTVSLVIPHPEYVLATVADATSDYLFAEKESVSNAWTGPFVTGEVYWLYWDIHPLTGAKTYGHTVYEPIEGSVTPPSPLPDQHWFDTSSNTMKVWNATAGRWVNKIRVFAAKLIAGSSLVSMSINSPAFEGTQVGSYVGSPILAGYLVFDDEGKALRKGNGKFFTTEDVGITGITSSSRVRLGSIVKEAESISNMANNTIVVFSDFDKVRPAEPSDFLHTKQFGIIEEDVVIGEFVNVITDGVVSSLEWDWTPYGVNTPLYVGAGGVLSVVPTAPALAPVAIVIGKNSIQLGTLEVNVSVTGAVVEPMTTSVAGVAKLSVAAISAVDPIVVGDNDPRMSDARIPLDHSHTITSIAGLQSELDGKLSLAGGTLSGALTLPADPTNLLEATTKQYVDVGLTNKSDASHTHDMVYVNVAGDTMTGTLTLANDPVGLMDAATKQYVDANAGGGGLTPQPTNQVVYGATTDIASDPSFTFYPDVGGLHCDFSSYVFSGPDNIELNAASTNTNHWAAKGGAVYLSSGGATVGPAQGGPIEIVAGNAVSSPTGGTGGVLTIKSGNGQYGGTVYITGGTGSDFGNGGPLDIRSGSGTGDAGGGYVSIIAGGGNYSGDIVMSCDPVTGPYGNRGGNVDVMGGTTTQTGRGGRVTISGGNSTTSTSFQQGGWLMVTEGGETLSGTPVSTAAAVVTRIKEHIQTDLQTVPVSAGFVDVNTISCSRRMVVTGISTFTPTFTQTLPVRIPDNTVWTFKALVSISYLQYGSDFAAFEVVGMVSNVGGTVNVHGATTTSIHKTGGAASWDVVAAADDTNNTLLFVSTLGGVGFRTVTIVVDVVQSR